MNEKALPTQGTNKPRRTAGLLRILLLIGVIYLGICLMLYSLQRKLIYVPRKLPVSIEESEYEVDHIREVSLLVEEEVNLLGWHCTVNPKETQKSDRLAIIFPGNGGNRLNRVKLLQLLNGLKCDALIFDYRGYGGSGGSPNENSIAADSHQIWEFAREELGYRHDQIIVLGQSLGGGVSTRLVSELCEQGDPPAGFILQATFTSLVDAAKHRFPWLPVNLLIAERYPSIERIEKVTCPLLFIHGQQDVVVPYRLGQQLFAAAPDQSANGIAKKFIDLPDAGHNNIMHIALQEITEAKQQFLTEIDRVTLEGE